MQILINLKIKFANSRAEFLPICMLFMLVIAIFSPVIHYMAMNGGSLDYIHHARFAQQMVETGQIQTPHFLYHWLIVTVHRVIPDNHFELAGAIVSGICYLALSAVLYTFLRSTITDVLSVYSRFFVSSMLTLSLMLLTPITIFFWWIDHDLYFGYLYSGNVYHNPTLLLIKPLSILLFSQAVQIYIAPVQAITSYAQMIKFARMAFLVVLSAIAKPNYLICVLPASVIMAAYRTCYQKQPIDWRLLIFGLILPAGCILIWQYDVTYFHNMTVYDPSRILFAPFAYFAHYSVYLFPKFLLSIAFPLCVYGLYFREAAQNLPVNFSWLTFLIGAFYSYFLVESTRMYTGNFVWSGQISLFVLFVTSTLFFIQQNKAEIFTFPIHKYTWRCLVCSVIFGLHLISGILWYIFHLK